MDLKPLAMRPVCSTCGSEDLTLAVNHIQYYRCKFDVGWKATLESTEIEEESNSIRFFCSECGTAHVVPDNIRGVPYAQGT